MRRLLVTTLLLLTLLSLADALRAQDDRRAETMQAEQPSASVVLTVKENRVRVQNARPGDLLEVYSIVGVKVASVRIESADDTIELNLSKGFYILKVGSVARKVVIR